MLHLPGSTISTLLHGKINPKDWQVLSLGDAGFLQFFRVVSSHYGKPRLPLNLNQSFIVDELVQFHRSFGYIWISEKKTTIGGGFTYVYFHPEPWGNDPIWLILFEWVGSTTRQTARFEPFGGFAVGVCQILLVASGRPPAKNRTNKSWFCAEQNNQKITLGKALQGGPHKKTSCKWGKITVVITL